MTLHEALITALDDEYRARATYQTVLDHYGQVWPFANIVHAEERHIAALVSVFQRYGLSIPSDRWAGNIQLNSNLLAECEAAVQAEIRNYQMYDRLMLEVTQQDVLMVFSNLRNASAYHHLPAFKACAASSMQAMTQPYPVTQAESGPDFFNFSTIIGIAAGVGLVWFLSRSMASTEG